ncbi:hypothetical protein ACLESD_01575 [Pyxidicoccus sp. 3LFB2]
MLDVLWMILMMPEMPDPKRGTPLGVGGARSSLELSERESERRERRRPARRTATAKAGASPRRSRGAPPA